VQSVREELGNARAGEAEARRGLSLGKISQEAYDEALARLQKVKGRFTYRMNDLSQFMKGLLQRFTTWYNRMNGRTGTLWEQRFKSIIVQDGTASRTMAAYIDLNPVRAGMVADPADYRWSSYGEAVAGGKKARAGLVRALHGHRGREGKVRAWAQGGVAKEYRAILLRGAVEVKIPNTNEAGELVEKISRKGMSRVQVEKELARLEKGGSEQDLAIGKAVSCRVRYFADGAVIGSKSFVNEVFQGSREYFGKRRQTGARKPRGSLGRLAGELWSARDLREGLH
jgi:putative transposase